MSTALWDRTEHPAGEPKTVGCCAAHWPERKRYPSPGESCARCGDTGKVQLVNESLRKRIHARYLDGMDDRTVPCPECSAVDNEDAYCRECDGECYGRHL